MSLVSKPLSFLEATPLPNSVVGIAFSGAVGIGIYQTSGEIIALGGPVGALLAVGLLSAHLPPCRMLSWVARLCRKLSADLCKGFEIIIRFIASTR